MANSSRRLFFKSSRLSGVPSPWARWPGSGASLPAGTPSNEIRFTNKPSHWASESVVASAFRRGDRKLIEQLKREIAYLNAKAVRLTVDGEERRRQGDRDA